MRSITVFDTDGGNPYGREVAMLLQQSNFDVDAILPEDVQWVPAGLRARKLQPMNRPSSLLAQLWRQCRTLWATAIAMLWRQHLLVVIMTRGWPDQLALMVSRLIGGRMLVVAHDPVPKTPMPWWHGCVRRWFWRSADVLVAHSDELARQAEMASGRPAAVVPHLPFSYYAGWAAQVAPHVAGAEVLRLLVLGQMRADKGLDRLPAILSHLPLEERPYFSLAFAGRGQIDDIVRQIEAIIPVVRDVSTQRLGDAEIAQALAEADLLIAPYPLVSASGTVALALSLNLPVIAYDTGAIGDVLASSGLVAPGDEAGFAAALRSARSNRQPNANQSLDAWQARSQAAWAAAASMAIASPATQKELAQRPAP